MSYFKKARKYTEPSVALDEKIAKANQEYEKTGVDLSEWSGNKTSGVYFAGKEIPTVPAEFTPVPDPNGVQDAGWTQPTNGFDENDPSTWDNAYTDTSWLYNSNDVAGETGRPVVDSVPTTWVGATNGAGILSAHTGWGQSLGYLDDNGVYKPMITSNLFGNMIPPIYRGTYSGGDHYKGDIPDDRWSAMQSMYQKFQEMAARTDVVQQQIKVWYGHSYFFDGSWENIGGVKRESDRHRLINATIFKGGSSYKSADEIPSYTQVIFKDDIGKPENLPNVRGGRLREILEELFGIGGSAADELASHDKSFSKYPAAGGSDKWPGLPADKLDYLHPSKDPLTNILSTPFGIKGADAGGDDDYNVAWGKPKGPASTSDKLPRAADINAVNWYNSGGDVGSKPEGWSDQDLRDYLNNRDKGFPGAQSSSGGGDGSQVASAAQTSPFPSDPASDASSSLGAKDGDEIAFGIFSKGEDGKLKINSADMQQYNWYKNTGDPSYIPAGADKEALEKEWQKKYGNQSSTWTPSSGTQVASTNLSGLFGSSGSGSGSTGQLNLPSWFQHGAGKNAKLDADGRIYGYNYSGGYGYLSRGPGSGAPGTAESGYGTKGFDWDSQSGGTSWSFTRHDPSKVAASPNSPDPVKPGDVPTAPSSPYLPGKSPYKVAANQGPSTPVKNYDGKFLPNMGGGRPGNIRPKGSAAFPQAKKDDTGRGGKGNNFGMGSAVVTKGKKKKKVVTASNEITGVVLNESNLLMEKNYLRDLREKKREKTNKIANKVMKINIPGPNDELTVRAIDLLRSYKVSEEEMQEYAIIIGNINNWIRMYPKEYAVWKVRYPKNDPRLAELNWRMDQQLRAADEYMDSHFPENQKLFGKLRQKIATNIDMSDPSNFKDVKPVVTHKKLLQVSKALEKE